MSLLTIVLLFVGNVLLGVAVWRSGTLPRWAGALWAGAAVPMYPLGIVYAATLGSQSTPPTVLAGAALVVVGGGWFSLSASQGSSAGRLSAGSQPRVQ